MKREPSEFELHLTGLERTLFAALLSGHFMHRDRLIFALYADRIDESPLDADNVLSVKVHSLRRKLRPHGIVIENKHGGNYRISPETVGKARALVRDTALPITVCPHCHVARIDA